MADFKGRLWILVAIFGLALILAFAFDRHIGAFIQRLVPVDVYFVVRMLSQRGLHFFYAVFAVLLVFSLLRNNRGMIRFIWSYIITQIIFALAIVRCMKIVFGRTRPETGSEFTFFSFDYHYNSFPSGHSADAFVSGVFLFYLLNHSEYSKYRFLPLIFAFLVAVSRVAVNAHYPSDVVAGMAVGVFGAWFFLSRLPDGRVENLS
jgi:undecaprenyl-diphosphatase